MPITYPTDQYEYRNRKRIVMNNGRPTLMKQESNGVDESNEPIAPSYNQNHDETILVTTSTLNDARDENSTARNKINQRGVCDDSVSAFEGTQQSHEHSALVIQGTGMGVGKDDCSTRNVSSQNQLQSYFQSIDENNEVRSEERDEASASFVPSMTSREESFNIYHASNSVGSDTSSLMSRLSVPNSAEASPNPNIVRESTIMQAPSLPQPLNSTPISSNHATLMPAHRYQFAMNQGVNRLPESAPSRQTQNQNNHFQGQVHGAYATGASNRPEITMPNGNNLVYHPSGAYGGSSGASTPNAPIQFSPFLAFSTERGTPVPSGNLIDISGRRVQEEDGNMNEAPSEDAAKNNAPTNTTISTNGNDRRQDVASIPPPRDFMPQNLPPHFVQQRFPFPFQHIPGHQSHPLFHHVNGIHAPSPTTMTPPPRLPVLKLASKKQRGKIPAAAVKIERRPQKRFSRNVGGTDECFGSKSNGKTRLTTNVPRPVKVLDAKTRERVFLFSSCSDASRKMGVNRTRMSRSKCK